MAIYYRTIKIDGVTYKQISPTQWQNLNTGQILDNTKITAIINEFKTRQVAVAPAIPTGACCTGGTCFGGGQATSVQCSSVGGTFYYGEPCSACDNGVFCIGSGLGQTCFGLGYRGQSLTNNFIVGGSCSSCILGACCTGGTCLNGGITNQAACISAGGLFYPGATCTKCDYGVFCTGSTCFGLGYRGEQLTNNFIVGGSCSSCILGACCTGGTCLGGGITSESACALAGGLFYPGATCTKCDYGVFCTGSTCFGLGYRGQELTDNFTAGATCSICIVGACCETVNEIMQCSEKSQQLCLNGCFKGQGSTCGNSNVACDTCVHCCFAGGTCSARTPDACVSAGGTYFAFGQGCTSCKYGVCSSDKVIRQRFFGNGCTGIFLVNGATSDVDFGVFCTGSGLGQTCAGTGYRYEQITNNFIVGASCSSCILGVCCTNNGCLDGGLVSQATCNEVGGLFYPGATCGQCDFGVFCTGLTTNRTCIRTGYRGEALSTQFQVGATCSYCITGTCCVNGNVSFGDSVRQSNCTGKFFPNEFLPDACDKGSCCVGAQCTENVYRPDCLGVFNNGMTCFACSSGSCCTPSGCNSVSNYQECIAADGVFYGGIGCSACDIGVCCLDGVCTPNVRRADPCKGTFYAGIDCSVTPCVLGICCTGGNCLQDRTSIECQILGGEHFPGATCGVCATGAICYYDENVMTCIPDSYLGEVQSYQSFYRNQGCSACDEGACCNQGGGGVIGIRGDCNSSGSSFFAGKTLSICDSGVFCTGSNQGQTCFGIGYRGQSLTNNFIQGANCTSCILGACCTGGTCLGNGITSQAACNAAGGVFFGGKTCNACDYGVYCTGATCISLGFRGQSLSNNFIVGATCSSCILGACCTGGTCSGGGQTSQSACNGLFYAGATCIACDYGVFCTGATCLQLGYRAQNLSNNFIRGATCDSCILGACCTGGTCLGGGQTSQAACNIAGGTFYVGATCFQCVSGVFCTGSDLGQTCFGLGHRGQSLTSNFIAGATCSSCTLGACCTGGTCLGGGLTNEAACISVGGLFYPGTTCISCDYGVYCTGSQENTSCLGFGYRAQNLSSNFVISGNCERECNYGACCQGTTCLGITSQSKCPKPYSFFHGYTCSECDTGLGACCTGGSSSITTISGCQSLGGIFFPEGTTALCVTGSCCTGGTCIQQLLGLSSSCELFISGATCSICDIGVFCTGSTCLQTGFRGQSLATVFLLGQTCNSCIQGICCKDDYQYLRIFGGKEHSVALTTQSEVRGFGGNTYGQSGMTFAIGYTAIAVGAYHTLALSSGGTVSAWGRNQYAQSTVPTGLTGVVQIAAGEYHSLALKSDGGVTCWGWNGQGQCTIPSGLTGVTMIASGMSHNLALRSNGTVVAWGYNFDGQTNVPAGLTGVIQVAAGYHHSLALLSDGGITCWGMTAYGQCNIPVGLTASKIIGGGYHTLILSENGGITAIGRNNYNQINVPSGFTAKDIGAGEFSSFAINSSNAVVTWGSNINGEGNITDISCESLNQKNCSIKFGIFKSGATNCFACAQVNCCTGGTCSYVLPEECSAKGGIKFEGARDCSVCDLGVFCDGRTCTNAGITFRGYSLSSVFLKNLNCTYCLKGTCCYADERGAKDSTENECEGTFFPGNYDPSVCNAEVRGLCCTEGVCEENKLQNLCTGYFITNALAAEKNLSCDGGACKIGPCCGETEIQSVTGGTCFGLMSQAQCVMITGGEFFASEDGYACTNCLYIPMLASSILTHIGNDPNFGTYIYDSSVTGFTGNEIFPRNENPSVRANTWLRYKDEVASRFYGPTGVTGPITLRMNNGLMAHIYFNLSGFTAWFSGKTASLNILYSGDWQGTTGIYDFSPIFGGATLRQKASSTSPAYPFGYIDGFTYESARYLRLTFDYGRQNGFFYGKPPFVYRHSLTNTYADRRWSLTDATNHAGLDPTKFNIFTSISPYRDKYEGNPSYGYPVLAQIFAENPLKYRVRQSGSCCVGATCIGIVTKDICQLRGGVFRENKRCDLCYPDLIKGNCCTGGTHAGFTSQAACFNIGGVFFIGTTYVANICDVGTICRENKTCIEPEFRYFGDFENIENRYFVKQDPNTFEGCTACSTSGICCTGSTCGGILTAAQCSKIGGTLYPNETECGTNCEFGVCCNIDGGCGTYTQRANCVSANQVFVAGKSQGETCSACDSLFKVTHNIPTDGVGVTYTYVFNKGTTSGIFVDGTPWVQESDDLRLLKIRTVYNVDKRYSFAYGANTRIAGLTLRSTGFIGSVYIHGCVKNPQPDRYIHPVLGDSVTKQAFSSLNYSDYSYGWIGKQEPRPIEPDSPGSTDVASNYAEFDLDAFNAVRNAFRFGNGLTMKAEDVFLIHTGNFDINNVDVGGRNDKYVPYFIIKNRGHCLHMGVLNCLSANKAALAGSTLCFRPPTSWPPEDIQNKPIYPASLLEGKIPGQPGNTLIVLDSSYIDSIITYNKKSISALSQTSEFGDGVNYNTTAPMVSMFGTTSGAMSYGEQYVAPIQRMLSAIHATGANIKNLTIDDRRIGLQKIVQYGIDAWGGQKVYSVCMSSGAGQKAGRTRGWIPLAGYYLGVSAMYDPEATMMKDPLRFPKYMQFEYGNTAITITPGITCVTVGQWKQLRWGGTGPQNNFRGTRKSLAASHAQEAFLMYETSTDPNNLVLYYAYPGTAYRGTIIQGYSTTGKTGVTFFNEYRTQKISDEISVEGNFGIIKWGQTYPNSSNPLSRSYFVDSTNAGGRPCWYNMGLRVESGPGSCGPGGKSRYYRIIRATGFLETDVAEDAPQGQGSSGGGWQIIIGQTWADGIPNENSVLKFYPLFENDIGNTRPDSFSPNGSATGPVYFISVGNPGFACNSNPVSLNYSTLYDANVSSHTFYFTNSLDAWAPQYLIADYIWKTKGITLVSDAVPIPDYIRQYIYTSPYNFLMLTPFYAAGLPSTIRTWLGDQPNDANFYKKYINFARDFPGIIKYRGITI